MNTPKSAETKLLLSISHDHRFPEDIEKGIQESTERCLKTRAAKALQAAFPDGVHAVKETTSHRPEVELKVIVLESRVNIEEVRKRAAELGFKVGDININEEDTTLDQARS